MEPDEKPAASGRPKAKSGAISPVGYEDREPPREMPRSEGAARKKAAIVLMQEGKALEVGRHYVEAKKKYAEAARLNARFDRDEDSPESELNRLGVAVQRRISAMVNEARTCIEMKDSTGANQQLDDAEMLAKGMGLDTFAIVEVRSILKPPAPVIRTGSTLPAAPGVDVPMPIIRTGRRPDFRRRWTDARSSTANRDADPIPIPPAKVDEPANVIKPIPNNPGRTTKKPEIDGPFPPVPDVAKAGRRDQAAEDHERSVRQGRVDRNRQGSGVAQDRPRRTPQGGLRGGSQDRRRADQRQLRPQGRSRRAAQVGRYGRKRPQDRLGAPGVRERHGLVPFAKLRPGSGHLRADRRHAAAGRIAQEAERHDQDRCREEAELDIATAVRNGDKLPTGPKPAPGIPDVPLVGPTPGAKTGADNLLKQQEALAQVEFQRLRSKSLRVESEATARFGRGETDAALQDLQNFIAEVKSAADSSRASRICLPVRSKPAWNA